MYDGSGTTLETNLNMCDCLIYGCDGCFFPCSKCNSQKCGHECRNYREYTYDKIISEVDSKVIENITNILI